jgi:small-conductance mechanosensitive channel
MTLVKTASGRRSRGAESRESQQGRSRSALAVPSSLTQVTAVVLRVTVVVLQVIVIVLFVMVAAL